MKTRLQNEISLMNALLCLCVIMIHLTATPVVELLPFSLPHIVIFLVNKTLVFAVPGFLFLSGLKLYSQYGSRDFDCKQFYLRRFQKIAIPYCISMTFYFIYYYAKNWASLSQLPSHLLLGTLVSHFYYIIIALQLYLLFPLLKKAVNRYPLAALFLSLVSTILFYAVIHPPYSDRYALTYLFFFVLGMLWSKYRLDSLFCNHLRTLTLLTAFIAIAHFPALYRTMYAQTPYRWANLITVFYSAAAMVLVYLLCQSAASKWESIVRLFLPLSRVSFSVYLYHMLPILLLEYDIFPRFALSVKFRFLISVLAVYTLVFLYAWVIHKYDQHSKTA